MSKGQLVRANSLGDKDLGGCSGGNFMRGNCLGGVFQGENVQISSEKITKRKKDDSPNKKFNKKRITKKRKQRITDIKNNSPDQNAYNLSVMFLTTPQKSLPKKGPYFVPITSDVNWLTLRKDFDKFVNQLRDQFKHTNQQPTTFTSELQSHRSLNDAGAQEFKANTQEQLPPPP